MYCVCSRHSSGVFCLIYWNNRAFNHLTCYWSASWEDYFIHACVVLRLTTQTFSQKKVIEIQLTTCNSVNVLSLIVHFIEQGTRFILFFAVSFFLQTILSKAFFEGRSFTSNYTHQGLLLEWVKGWCVTTPTNCRVISMPIYNI